MAELQCPNCGRNNPDFLDTCQFCQNPLHSETSLRLGESPVKKHTGELEPILPQWLKDVRQQARESAAENAADEAAKPKVRNEPPDLLAGLAAQGKDEGEDVPDWLAGMNSLGKAKDAEPASAPKPVSDFFAQFEQNAPAVEPLASEETTTKEDMPSWMSGSAEAPQSETRDELSEWFSKASAEESAPVEVDSNEMDWSNDATATPSLSKQAEPEKEPEDLGWLHALEDSTKHSQPPAAPAFAPDATLDARAPGSEDLSWLDQLGGASAIAFDAPVANQPEIEKPQPAESASGDLSWLDALGSSGSSTLEDSSSAPSLPADARDWLKPQDAPKAAPFEEKPVENNLDWLKGAGQDTLIHPPADETISPFTKIPTGSLDGGGDEPDWLKSATEAPSMPAPGALSDWFKDDNAAAHSPLQPVPIDPNFIPAPLDDSSSLSSKEIDSLFSVDMPDWIAESKPETEEDASQPTPIPSSAAFDDSLAPVNLPSWVQAMRPAESAVVASSTGADEPAEREGPLAGLAGIIPVAPIGSSRRPKSISLKLQASEEQQSAVSILETVLAGETAARVIGAQAMVTSQRILRWVISAVIFIVLGTMSFMRSQNLPVSADLPAAARSSASIIARLPQNPNVLVVIDYEPALAPEMEAVSGPMLDQLVLTTRARLFFVSTSPSGAALVERLLAKTGITSPTGINYQLGTDYANLGYLPGGASGVRAFIDATPTDQPAISDYAAILVITDSGESGRLWVEQLVAKNQADSAFFDFQPLLFAASAQAAPLLQPYVDAEQINGLVGGLADAVRYEYVNNSRPGIARAYWDSFGMGLLLAVALIAIGSLWSLILNLRARRGAAETG
jgi:hypothetical protein